MELRLPREKDKEKIIQIKQSKRGTGPKLIDINVVNVRCVSRCIFCLPFPLCVCVECGPVLAALIYSKVTEFLCTSRNVEHIDSV